MFILALRNIIRNLKRLKSLIVIMGLSFMLLFTVNSIMENIDSAFSSAFIDNLTGHGSISPPESNAFSLFGSDALLVGEYLVPPTFDDFERLRILLENDFSSYRYLPVVSSAAQISVRNIKKNQVLLGVDFKSYFHFFPDFNLIAGTFPESGEKGIMLQQETYEYLLSQTDTESLLGEPILLSVAYNSSFTIREVPLVGVFCYSVEDDVLDRVSIVDADTARSLNGYIYGATEAVKLGDEEQNLIDTSLDDLFLTGLDDLNSNEASEDNLFDTIDELFNENNDLEQAVEPVSDAWNFVLMHGGADFQENSYVNKVQKILKLENAADNYLVRDWRQTIKGNVLIVWFIRVLINIGIIFILMGAVAVTVNAIILSVLERRKEIGTIRALGAKKYHVGLLMVYEVVLIILGSALIGIIISVILVAIINDKNIYITNRYLLLLTGATGIEGKITLELFILHILGAVGIALVALVYPLKKILGLSPVKAMN